MLVAQSTTRRHGVLLSLGDVFFHQQTHTESIERLLRAGFSLFSLSVLRLSPSSFSSRLHIWPFLKCRLCDVSSSLTLTRKFFLLLGSRGGGMRRRRCKRAATTTTTRALKPPTSLCRANWRCLAVHGDLFKGALEKKNTHTRRE